MEAPVEPAERPKGRTELLLVADVANTARAKLVTEADKLADMHSLAQEAAGRLNNLRNLVHTREFDPTALTDQVDGIQRALTRLSTLWEESPWPHQ